MITSLILYLLLGLILTVSSPLRLFNDVNALNSNIADTISEIGTKFAVINTAIPINTLLTILGLLVTVEIAIFTYKGIMWLIKKIPTIS